MDKIVKTILFFIKWKKENPGEYQKFAKKHWYLF